MAETSMEKSKRQGPIRVEAIVPLLVISGLVYGYFALFFDSHLRRALQYAATRANGAQVDVGELKTSVFGASVLIRDIQVTDAQQPQRNLVQVGEVRLQLLWDALLRAKVVVEHADVLNIGVNTPRAQPGTVLPVEKSSGPGVADRLLADLKRQVADNVLGDLAAVAEGADPGEQLGKLADNLASRARLAELQVELESKQTQWQERIAKLPKPETVTALQQRLAKVKLERFKNLEEVQASLRELEAIRDEVQGHVKNVRSTGDALTADVNAYKAVYGELERLVKKDIAELQAHFRIPTLDAGNLSNALFGNGVLDQVAQARGYMDKAREYMPPQRSAEEKAAMRLQPHEREQGRDYVFGRPNAYPRFWLKQAVVSSSAEGNAFAGDLRGEIRDVATEPAMLSRLMTVTLMGDFPRQGIRGTKAELVVDHRTAEPSEKFSLSIARYDVAGRTLVASDPVTLGFNEAKGAVAFVAELRGEHVALRLDNDYTDVAYRVDARSPLVKDIISGAVNGVPKINFTASIGGTWDKLDWALTSNLGAELGKGFRREIQAQIDAARARVEAMVNERIALERRKLLDQVAAAENQLKAQVAARQAELDKLLADFETRRAEYEQQKNAVLKAQEQKLKKEVKKEADKLLDSLRKRL